MSHIFISYSTRNSDYAYHLAEKLREEGFDIWIDNNELRPSVNWWESIVIALRTCVAFVVIMTPESRTSPWVQREVFLAARWNKPTFPILLAGAGEDWEIFVLTQYEDVSIKPNPNKAPQYAGRLPRSSFYIKLAEFAPSKRYRGIEILPANLGYWDKLDDEVTKEIANPPLTLPELPPQDSPPKQDLVAKSFPITPWPPSVAASVSEKSRTSDLQPVTAGSSHISGEHKTPSKIIFAPPPTRPKIPLPVIAILLILSIVATFVAIVTLAVIFAAAQGKLKVQTPGGQDTLHTDVPTLPPTPTIPPSPTAPGGGSGEIAFSSDRSGNREIYVMNLYGNDLRNITNSGGIDDDAAWSPDGQQIAFESNRDGNFEIYVMNADGSGLRRLTINNANDTLPAWSPDGRFIAFTSDRDNNIAELYLMNTDGSDQHNLINTSPTDGFPAWSPGGSQITFGSFRDGNDEVYKMNIDGSNRYNLTNNPGPDGVPAWSPDGKFILFGSVRDSNHEVYIMTADGQSQQNLSNNPAFDDFPAWSPDGHHVTFTSNRDGNEEIYIMNPDGSNQHNLTNDSGDDLNSAWRPALQTPISPGQLPYQQLITSG